MNATITRLHDPVASALTQVARVFDEELRSDQAEVAEACERLGCYRGKMLRPTLLLLSAKASGDVRREHVVLAAVVEMVHVATLVHDDVLDDADIRRGAPTVNRVDGNEAAVLLGDYLISHAYHLCSSLGDPAAARRIAATTNTVCEGELMQVARRGRWDLTEAEYLEIIQRKTASLTAICCELGASYAGADEARVEALRAYGADLGMAFQITDDLLDLTADEAEVGKSLGRDADLGKLTIPLIDYLRRLDESDRQRVTQQLARGDFRLNGDVRRLGESLEYASGLARSYVESAVGRLVDLPPSDAKDALVGAAEFVLHRRQ